MLLGVPSLPSRPRARDIFPDCGRRSSRSASPADVSWAWCGSASICWRSSMTVRSCSCTWHDRAVVAAGGPVRVVVGDGQACARPRRAGSFEPDSTQHSCSGFASQGRTSIRERQEIRQGRLDRKGPLTRTAFEAGHRRAGRERRHVWQATRARRAPIRRCCSIRGVAGIGNIYADEALFLAGVRVTRPAHRLSRAECDAVISAAQRVMRRSIETAARALVTTCGPTARTASTKTSAASTPAPASLPDLRHPIRRW